MSSSRDTIYNSRLEKEAALAGKLLAKNLADMDDSTALAVTESFRLMRQDLDRVPMTRNQRDELDLHLKTIGLLIESQS